MRTTLLCLGFVLAQVSANLCFKMVEGRSAPSLGWFIAGNVIGFFCTVFLTLALRNNNPNIIYALCFGGGFFFLQLFSCVLFKSTLTSWQWFAITLIGSGILLLQLAA